MKYTIQATPSFTILGIKRQIQTDKAFEIVPHIWKEYRKNGILAQLYKSTGINKKTEIPSGILGVAATGKYEDSEMMDYYVGVSNQPETDNLANFSSYEFPASTWIVFEGNKMKDIPLIYDYFKNQWLPHSGYKCADIPTIESYLLNNKYMHIWSPYYIWFGIQK